MNDQAEPAAPKTLIQSLDGSLRDLETGAITDAADIQAEAQRLLTEYESKHSAALPSITIKHAGAA